MNARIARVLYFSSSLEMLIITQLSSHRDDMRTSVSRRLEVSMMGQQSTSTAWESQAEGSHRQLITNDVSETGPVTYLRSHIHMIPD